MTLKEIPMKGRENALGDRPGALRSQAVLEIQTRQAQRLVYGRKPEPENWVCFSPDTAKRKKSS